MCLFCLSQWIFALIKEASRLLAWVAAAALIASLDFSDAATGFFSAKRALSLYRSY